jgi:hypothetical protein
LGNFDIRHQHCDSCDTDHQGRVSPWHTCQWLCIICLFPSSTRHHCFSRQLHRVGSALHWWCDESRLVSIIKSWCERRGNVSYEGGRLFSPTIALTSQLPPCLAVATADTLGFHNTTHITETITKIVLMMLPTITTTMLPTTVPYSSHSVLR